MKRKQARWSFFALFGTPAGAGSEAPSKYFKTSKGLRQGSSKAPPRLLQGSSKAPPRLPGPPGSQAAQGSKAPSRVELHGGPARMLHTEIPEKHKTLGPVGTRCLSVCSQKRTVYPRPWQRARCPRCAALGVVAVLLLVVVLWCFRGAQAAM